MKVKEVVDYLEKHYPLDMADDFDNNKVGFIIGSKNLPLTGVLLSLDLSLEVVNEAIKIGANLIVTHHPYLFNPITKIMFDSEQGKVLEKMLLHKISLYSMHTNFDVAYGGVNDVLISLLCCKDIQVINGEVGKYNYLRYGTIEPMPFSELIALVREKYQLAGVRVVGNLTSKIKTVGVIGGSGGKETEISEALHCGCDCYITGEIRLSAAQYAKSVGLNLIEVNHGVEKLALYPLADKLKSSFVDLSINVSEIDTDPLMAM